MSSFNTVTDIFLFSHSYVQQDMGTILLILREMMIDFINLATLMFIFLTGYGIALVGLVTNPSSFIVDNLVSIFYYPFFQLFGEMNTEDLVIITVTNNGVTGRPFNY